MDSQQSSGKCKDALADALCFGSESDCCCDEEEDLREFVDIVLFLFIVKSCFAVAVGVLFLYIYMGAARVNG
ncbi:hypothetical protein TSUD_258940 [Trifolium subterraneum]|uniref:Uncharacterized protein n=1 Tax=Trifolium subterraneum TaxID=3900 RepID=A0A2Z6NVY7_TRISU|nr:hypothetical protein TSUD_258940 [Trifolium subterraneum]